MNQGRSPKQNPNTNRCTTFAGRACSTDEEATVTMLWALTFGMQTGQRPCELLSVKYVLLCCCVAALLRCCGCCVHCVVCCVHCVAVFHFIHLLRSLHRPSMLFSTRISDLAPTTATTLRADIQSKKKSGEREPIFRSGAVLQAFDAHRDAQGALAGV